MLELTVIAWFLIIYWLRSRWLKLSGVIWPFSAFLCSCRDFQNVRRLNFANISPKPLGSTPSVSGLDKTTQSELLALTGSRRSDGVLTEEGLLFEHCPLEDERRRTIRNQGPCFPTGEMFVSSTFRFYWENWSSGQFYFHVEGSEWISVADWFCGKSRSICDTHQTVNVYFQPLCVRG